jgi:23S rRNA (adenine2503-C2)-methyltransferase
MPMTELHDSAGLARLCKLHRCDPHSLRPLVRAVLQRGESPRVARAALRSELPVGLLEELDWSTPLLRERRDSAEDGASKLLLQARGGAEFEVVLLRVRSGRTALCVSIQAGCAAGCAFCATGGLGLRGRLQLSDVLGSVLLGRRLAAEEGRALRNLVFMGMGEPLFEEELLHACLERLCDPRGFAFAPRRICVSTVGVPSAMLRLARAHPDVRQALSLHSARGEVRRELIPLAEKHSLEDLRAAVAEVGQVTGGRVLIEYLLLEGLTDRAQDESALCEWLDGLPVHLNLLPYNALASTPALVPTRREAREAFASRMRARGFRTTLRRSLGGDVAAACGELAAGGGGTP